MKMRIIGPAVALALVFEASGFFRVSAASTNLTDRQSIADNDIGDCTAASCSSGDMSGDCGPEMNEEEKDGGTTPASVANTTASICTCVESSLPSLPLRPEEDAIIVSRPDPDIVGYPISRYASDRRNVDPADTVRPEHAGKDNPLGVSAGEWRARTELAAAYRALYVLGLERSSLGSDQSAQCVMHRLDDDAEGAAMTNAGDDRSSPIKFLMAEWGVWFEEVTASNLLKFTVDGLLVPPDESEPAEASRPDRTNSGCVPVAKAIFESRPDVRTIVHIHPYAVMAVGGLDWGLLPLSQAAFFLWGQVSREDYDFTYASGFEDALAGGFRNGERAMLLNHHGMYAVGRDVAEALFVATHLTQACEVQVRTLGMVGGDLRKVVLPTGEQLSAQYRDMMDSTDYSYDGSREWPGIVRKLRRQAPDYNT